MKNIMEQIKTCKGKQLAALFLLTAVILFLVPGGKAHAAEPIDISTLQVDDVLHSGFVEGVTDPVPAPRSAPGFVVPDLGPVVPDPEPGPAPEPTPEPDVPIEPEKHAGPCHHEYEWETQREATATTAGLMYYKCRKCGYVAQVLEISGFSAFLEDTAKSVRAAEPNATVTADTNIWTSFNRSVIDALTERPDVTMSVTYKYEGKYYNTGIPAGADLSGLIDENGYCGFRYLDQVFGGTEIIR